MAEKYDSPKEREVELEVEKSIMILEQIKQTAKENNIPIQDPNPNCRKKGCYGRGYTGVLTTTKQPIPCSCIFPKNRKK